MDYALRPLTPHPTAMLFGGGGAKGAFQIGAWKALAEAGMLFDITAAAGCSVGALNAVLFALGDLEFAKSIWTEIQPADLLARGSRGAFFSRDGLIRIISRLPLERIRDNDKRLYVSVQHLEQKSPVFFSLNGQTPDAIRTLLLASSAIPHVYAPEYYLGSAYVDGGATPEGELCISPVYHLGHRDLLLLSLRSSFSLYGGRSGGLLRAGTTDLTTLYPDCRFTVIKPMQPMGNLITGTLNFAPEKIRQRMQQGYDDTKAALTAMQNAPRTPEEINRVLAETMQRLFPTGALLERFLQQFANRFAPNLQMQTLGGNVWYDNIYSVDGWRLQQMRTAGLQKHYRFLDPQNRRIAWVMDPKALLNALGEYEASR